MNYKYLSDIYTGENEFKREKMQFFFDKSFREKDENLLRNQYIELRKIQFNEGFDFVSECVPLSSLAENVTIACDILATGTGVSFIYCGDDGIFVQGSGKLITKALLNLLSNAYLYGKENLITVKAVNTEAYTKIEVLSGGFLENSHDGMGLTYVRKVMDKMGGKLLIEQSSSHTKAVMIFKSSSKVNFNTDNYDFMSYVNDRLSPVCVEMFGMEYHIKK